MKRSDRSPDAPSRQNVVRDVLIFQVKLWLEGFKDIVLMPLSLGAAVIDLFFRGSGSRGALYSVMKLGDQFERWVHLYAAMEEREEGEKGDGRRANSLDDLLHGAADEIEQKAANGQPDATDANRSGS